MSDKIIPKRPERPPTDDELKAAIAALMPFHCSYPEGKRRSKQTGLPCRANKLEGKESCQFHGGRTGKGAAHPQFKTGRYSKYMPERLISRFQEAKDDPDLIAAHAELALLTIRIEEIMESFQVGCGAEAFELLREQHSYLEAAYGDEDPDGIKDAMDEIGRIIAGAGAAEQSWGELYKALEIRTKTAEKEWKRQRDLRSFMTMNQAMDLVAAIVGSVQSRVTDKDILLKIHGDLNLILNSPGAVIEPLRRPERVPVRPSTGLVLEQSNEVSDEPA